MPATERHVVASERGGWDVRKPDAARASAHADRKREAVSRAREIVAKCGGGQVVVHTHDGTIERSIAIDAASPSTLPAADGSGKPRKPAVTSTRRTPQKSRPQKATPTAPVAPAEPTRRAPTQERQPAAGTFTPAPVKPGIRVARNSPQKSPELPPRTDLRLEAWPELSDLLREHRAAVITGAATISLFLALITWRLARRGRR